MGKGYIAVCWYCSFIFSFVVCRRMAVHGVTVFCCFSCEVGGFLSLGSLFLICGFTSTSHSLREAMSSTEGLPLPVQVAKDIRGS